MAELSKAERINKARELYNTRSQLRPVQVTAPTSDHVVGWVWPKVDESTLVYLEDIMEDQ